jgi:hypothetical protein
MGAILVELGQYQVSEGDLSCLLEAYYRGARDIIGANWAAVSILGEDETTKDQLFVNGLDHGVIAALDAREARLLGDVIRERCPYRLRSVGGEAQMMGLPSQFRPINSFLLVGVVAMFTRHPMTDATLEAIAAVANSIALSVERLHARDALHESELRFHQLTEHIHEAFFI